MAAMLLGDKIKKRRIELGITQMELALKVGLTSDTTICKVESNERGVPLKKLKRYAEALNVSLNYLIGDNLAYEDMVKTTEDYELDKKLGSGLNGTLRGLMAVLNNTEKNMVIEYAKHLYRSRNEKKE